MCQSQPSCTGLISVLSKSPLCSSNRKWSTRASWKLFTLYIEMCLFLKENMAFTHIYLVSFESHFLFQRQMIIYIAGADVHQELMGHFLLKLTVV